MFRIEECLFAAINLILSIENFCECIEYLTLLYANVSLIKSFLKVIFKHIG